MQHRRVDRADLQLDGAGITELLGERDVLPAEARPAEIDRDRAVRVLGGVEDAGDRLEGEILAPRLGGEGGDHAAHAVAAGLRPAAVGIDDLDIVLRARRPRVVNRHDLVEMRRRVGRQRQRRRRRAAARAAAHVGDDDLVADPVHAGEGDALAHGLLYGGNGRRLPVSPAAGDGTLS